MIPGSLHTIVGLKHRWSMRHMRVKTQGFNALNLATFGLMLMTLMTILLFRSCFGDAVQFGQYFFQQPPYLIIILGVTWLNLFRAGDATVSPVGVRDICVLELQPCTCTRSVRLLDSTALIEVFCLRRPLQNSFFSCAQVCVQTSRLSCFSSLRYTSRSEVQLGSSMCLIKCMREEALSDHRLQLF